MPEPAEQRRHPRFDIELDARISDTRDVESACVIRNFCQGGLLAQGVPSSGSDSMPFARGASVRVATRIITSAGERLLRLKARVAWVRDTYLGLSFENPSTAIVDVLQYHQRSQNGQAAGSTDAPSTDQAHALSQLRRVAKGELPGMLQHLIDDISEALLVRAEQAVSNQECQQIFVDINVFESLRSGDVLLQEVLARAESGPEPASEPNHDDDGELSLIDTEEFEYWLEASRAQNLLNRRFNKRIGVINARLAALSEHRDAAPSVPFQPGHFTGALRQIARDLGLGAVTHSVLFDRAAVVLGEQLDRFYRVLERALDAMGAPAAQEQVLRVVQSTTAAVDHSMPADEDAHAAVADTEAGSGKAAGPPRSIPIDQELLARLAENARVQREAQARALMSHVSAIPNMTESLAGWLALLQAPMVRQAASDASFFRNPQHPLRKIVDALGHLQMFRANPDMPHGDPLRAQVSELLRPISEGADDPETLTSIAASVSELTQQESKLYQRSVERVVEACEGKERLRQARQTVVAEVNRRYAGQPVPALLPQLLEAGWRSALELSALNGDHADSAFHNQLALTDVLVAKLGGKAFERSPGEIQAIQLRELISGELTQLAFDPFSRNAVEKRLHAELEGEHIAPVELVEMEALRGEPDVPADHAPPDGIGESAWQKCLAHCNAIRAGDRLRFLDTPGQPEELRVAWVRPDHRLLTLVDHRGVRTRDISRLELAKGLHRHAIALDHSDGQPLSERAVDAVLAGMEERLEHQASHDSLTGLINRQQFNVALEQAHREAALATGSGALLWIDIDHFRLVNEVHGHETADRLLVAVARQLEQVPGASLVGHLGGDRFALLLPDMSAADAMPRAQNINESIGALPFEWGGNSMPLSVSIGLVDLGISGNDNGALLKAAENAHSMAKLAGGNQVYLYRDDDPDIARHRESVQWLTQVDDALEKGQLHLRCQPIVPVLPGEGLAPHYEVLLGVHNSSDQPLPIGGFIEAAERYNRMRAVDRWVARSIMEWIAEHRAQMPSLHGFAVNLSGQTASDPGFVDFVRQQFQRTGIDPAWLSFEVTETAAVSDLSSSAGIVGDLKALGCKVALDDFGSGLASYSYLKELPVDWLKIDGAFVRGIAADRGDYAVVKSINEIGHFLGKQTIAEYVADAEILRSVTEIGVDYAQGFEISPPVLLDELVKLQNIA